MRQIIIRTAVLVHPVLKSKWTIAQKAGLYRQYGFQSERQLQSVKLYSFDLSIQVAVSPSLRSAVYARALRHSYQTL